MPKVLAGGCFNTIHPGHKYFLREAKKLTKGGELVLVLTNDANNLKPNPVPAAKRKAALKKLYIADKIVIGSSSNFSAIVKKLQPDIIALGYDQELPVKFKGKVVRIKKFGDYSTSK
jgi:FAD synthetase